jgi:hypothetical protein
MAGIELALTMLQHRRVARSGVQTPSFVVVLATSLCVIDSYTHWFCSAHGPLGAAILPGWNSPDLPSREDLRPFFFLLLLWYVFGASHGLDEELLILSAMYVMVCIYALPTQAVVRAARSRLCSLTCLAT